MTYFEVVVMWGAVLAVARAAWSVLKYASVAGLTALHFDEKTFYEKYDRAAVEAMSERGGW
jgi:hypothetical protein